MAPCHPAWSHPYGRAASPVIFVLAYSPGTAGRGLMDSSGAPPAGCAGRRHGQTGWGTDERDRDVAARRRAPPLAVPRNGTYAALHVCSAVFDCLPGNHALGSPVFLTALLAQIVFFGHFGWLPAGGRISGNPPTAITHLYLVDSLLTLNFRAFGSAFSHILLPSLALGLSRFGVVMRFVDEQVTAALHAEYVRTARAKGLSERIVVWRHAMRNALIPVVTIVGLQFGWLLGGTVIVESIFSWPGLGNYMVNSITSLDFMPVIGTAVVLGAAFAVINFIVDVVQQFLDPRMAEGS